MSCRGLLAGAPGSSAMPPPSRSIDWLWLSVYSTSENSGSSRHDLPSPTATSAYADPQTRSARGLGESSNKRLWLLLLARHKAQAMRFPDDLADHGEQTRSAG